MDIILPAFSVCHTSGPEVEWAHESGGVRGVREGRAHSPPGWRRGRPVFKVEPTNKANSYGAIIHILPISNYVSVSWGLQQAWPWPTISRTSYSSSLTLCFFICSRIMTSPVGFVLGVKLNEIPHVKQLGPKQVLKHITSLSTLPLFPSFPHKGILTFLPFQSPRSI